ncbi:hypothetical protein RHMOL_Rhmol04G0354000 [Rhododendron molle]|uniref:Uncharacterized protein n=1 Tax=Rhododendron molle TaxID=49168 RepID=A0ACC0PA21_RHOML|nr:hypothetical protein RHMOL_Rhmol04G0354000 [Rhododendron molle]
MAERDKEWDLYTSGPYVSSMAGDSNFASDPASDPSLLNSVCFPLRLSPSNGMVTFDALLSSVVSGLDAIICCH